MNAVVTAWFDEAIASEPVTPPAFVNQAHTPLPEPVIEQSVVWNALKAGGGQLHTLRVAAVSPDAQEILKLSHSA